METKVCTKCGEEKPATKEFFFRQKKRPDGLNTQCKDCKNEYSRKYDKENREHIREINRKCYAKNSHRWRGRHKKQRADMPAAVYAIVNKKNNFIYIGSSTAIPARFSKHKSQLKLQRHENPKLQEDYNKYGLDVFEFKLIEEHPCDTDSKILQNIEEKTIKRFLAEGKQLYNFKLLG